MHAGLPRARDQLTNKESARVVYSANASLAYRSTSWAHMPTDINRDNPADDDLSLIHI